jgi:hypothetical protein
VPTIALDVEVFVEMDLEFGELPPSRSPLGEICEERWERARGIDIFDLVLGMTGLKMKGSAISCPLGHGVGAKDSRPSFYLYKNTNSCYCFGCPPGKNFFDPVGFVSAFMDMSPTQALIWLEKKYNLPPLEPSRAEEEEAHWLITVEDLKETYFRKVRSSLRQDPRLSNAKLYMQIYWESMDLGDPTGMASVIGRERVEQIMRRLSVRAGK